MFNNNLGNERSERLILKDFNPHNAENVFVYSMKTKGFFQFEIILNVLVSSFSLI